MMKNTILAAAVFAIGACGGNKAPDTTKTMKPETKPDEGSGSAKMGSAAPDAACKAAGGTCMNMTADVVCKSKPAAECPTNTFCCGM